MPSARDRASGRVVQVRTSSRARLKPDPLLVTSLLVILLGAALRFGSLGGDSLWYDEVLTLGTARIGLNAATGVRDHPPLLYLLSAIAVSLFGESEFSIRFPSAIAGTLALPLVFVLGRRLDRRRTGFWALLLLTLSPFHLRYSQEARHYALLMTVSLATLVLLHRALTDPKLGRWLAFGCATGLNLYTHYGAFPVLASQAILIGIWSVGRIRAGRPWSISYPLVAALVVVVVCLPWIGHLRLALVRNVGENAARGATDITPLSTWLREILVAFGFTSGPFAALIAGLVALGLVMGARQRDWKSLGLVATGLLPVLLVVAFRVARWAFPKYVIFALPVYLLAAAVGLDTLLKKTSEASGRWRPQVYVAGSAVVVLALLLACKPLIENEYQRMERDWRGVAEHLSRAANEGDVYVSMAMDLPNGFNQGGVALPYYLEQTGANNLFLASGSLRTAELLPLIDTGADVWGVLLNRVRPAEPTKDGIQVKEFQGSLYLVHHPAQVGSALEKITALFEEVLPLAVSPSPQCLLKQDLAAMYAVSQDYSAAQRTIDDARQQCPNPPRGGDIRNVLAGQVYHALLDEFIRTGQTDLARQTSEVLLEWDAKDEAAWDALTFENLLHVFEQGRAQASAHGAPEPVQVRRYVMPHNGDWGQVLFIHPPSSVSFRISVPEDPIALRCRVAMAPESWEWGGDGSSFVVLVQTGDSEPVELFRRHVGNHSSDRGWHEVHVPLETYAGQVITLILTTEAGPQGDSTGDWAGWETPRLVWQ